MPDDSDKYVIMEKEISTGDVKVEKFSYLYHISFHKKEKVRNFWLTADRDIWLTIEECDALKQLLLTENK